MEPLLTTEEVADFLRVDIVTVRRLVNRGELPAYRIGNEYRFTRADLEDYVKRQRVTAGDKPGREVYDKSTERLSKFTERARKVLTLSQEEAKQLNHNYIGTEHLLLGLVSEGEGVAARVLSSLGVELDKARNEIMSILKRGHEKSNPVLSKIKSAMMQGEIVIAGRQVVLTQRAKKVIDLAADEARLLGHQYIETEHLLLGIIREGEGLAVGVLESLGVDMGKLRAQTLQNINEQQADL